MLSYAIIIALIQTINGIIINNNGTGQIRCNLYLIYNN